MECLNAEAAFAENKSAAAGASLYSWIIDWLNCDSTENGKWTTDCPQDAVFTLYFSWSNESLHHEEGPTMEDYCEFSGNMRYKLWKRSMWQSFDFRILKTKSTMKLPSATGTLWSLSFQRFTIIRSWGMVSSRIHQLKPIPRCFIYCVYHCLFYLVIMVPVEKGWIELQQSPHLSFEVNKPFHPRNGLENVWNPTIESVPDGNWRGEHPSIEIPASHRTAGEQCLLHGALRVGELRVRLASGCKVTCFGLAACGCFLLRDSWCYLRYKYLFEARHMTFSGPATDFPALPESKG